jgi:hypothetical protein
MGDGSLIWADESWRDRYNGRPTRRRLPRGYRSQAMSLLDEAEKRRLEQLAVESVKAAAHIRRLKEQAEVEKWEPLVRRYGAGTVEEVMKHRDPGFELPAKLRPEPTPQWLAFEED